MKNLTILPSLSYKFHLKMGIATNIIYFFLMYTIKDTQGITFYIWGTGWLMTIIFVVLLPMLNLYVNKLPQRD